MGMGSAILVKLLLNIWTCCLGAPVVANRPLRCFSLLPLCCPPHLYSAHLTLSPPPLSTLPTLSAPQIGPLVRLLVVASDRLNRLFGLSKPLTAEEESEPPESVGQQAVRWLRRRHYR